MARFPWGEVSYCRLVIHILCTMYTTLFGCYKKNTQEKNMLILEKHSFFSCAVVALTACRSAIPVDCQPGCGHVPHFCIKCLECFFLLLVNLCRCRFIDSQTRQTNSLSSPPVNSIFATLECDLKRHNNSTALHLQLSTIGSPPSASPSAIRLSEPVLLAEFPEC